MCTVAAATILLGAIKRAGFEPNYETVTALVAESRIFIGIQEELEIFPPYARN